MYDNILKGLQATIGRLQIEINHLYKDIENSNTEINRLKMIIELKDDARIELVEENKRLKDEIDEQRMLITTAKNDYKYCYAENIRLADENNNLRSTIKAYELLFY